MMEAVELSKEQDESALEQCFVVMQGTHGRLLKFLLEGLPHHDAMKYLDLISMCRDKERMESMLKMVVEYWVSVKSSSWVLYHVACTMMNYDAYIVNTINFQDWGLFFMSVSMWNTQHMWRLSDFHHKTITTTIWSMEQKAGIALDKAWHFLITLLWICS